MAIITIERKNGIVVFNPSPAYISPGDVVVFRNEDPEAGHLITRGGQDNPKFWFQYPLAPFVSQPADTSDEVFFKTAGTVTYVCVTDGHTGESGTIVVQVPQTNN